MNIQDRLRALVEPIVTDLGLELFDLEYSGATLVVTLERPSAPAPAGADAGGADPLDTGSAPRSGVGIDDITKVTRAVSRALDEADPISGKYALEVSSPGLERALRVPAHYAWAVGQKVSVKTVPSFEGGRRLKGDLIRADADSIDVRLDGPDEVTATIRYDEIDKARTVFEWGGEPKPAKPPKPGSPKAGSPKAGSPKAGSPKAGSPKAGAKAPGERSAKQSAKKSAKKSTKKPTPAAGPATGEVPGSSTARKTTAAKNSKKVTAS